MAAKKKAAKKATKKKATRKKSAVAKLEAELPKSLRGYTTEVRKRLSRLERDVEKARSQASRRGTKLLREASEYVGRVEAKGEKEWRRRRTEAASLLRRLEKAVEPPRRKTAKKKAAKKSKTRR